MKEARLAKNCERKRASRLASSKQANVKIVQQKAGLAENAKKKEISTQKICSLDKCELLRLLARKFQHS